MKLKWVNYADKDTILSNPLPREKSCRLDSKARLVLPLDIRDFLKVSYGDCVSIQIIGKNNGGIILKLASAPVTKEFVKISKNAWEKR